MPTSCTTYRRTPRDRRCVNAATPVRCFNAELRLNALELSLLTQNHLWNGVHETRGRLLLCWRRWMQERVKRFWRYEKENRDNKKRDRLWRRTHLSLELLMVLFGSSGHSQNGFSSKRFVYCMFWRDFSLTSRITKTTYQQERCTRDEMKCILNITLPKKTSHRVW